MAGLKLRAEVALLSSDVPAAAARFEEALGLAPASPDLLAARACMRGLLGDCAGAAEGFAAAARAASKAEDERRFANEAALHRAVARDLPGEEGRAARAALFRGVWLDGHKRSADALAAYDECVRLAPRLAQARARRGRARLAAGQGALALEDLTAWVELEPASGHALAERATARLRLGDRAGALTDFERSLEVEPGHPRADVARREVTRLRRALGR